MKKKTAQNLSVIMMIFNALIVGFFIGKSSLWVVGFFGWIIYWGYMYIHKLHLSPLDIIIQKINQ